MKTITITDIQWDTDDDDEILQTLPTETIIDSPTEEMLQEIEDEDPYMESINDYLSDTYGFCMFGYNIEIND